MVTDPALQASGAQLAEKGAHNYASQVSWRD
jgi:hypothetical protein